MTIEEHLAHLTRRVDALELNSESGIDYAHTLDCERQAHGITKKDRDALRAQVADLERERDALVSWRCDVTVALGRPQGTFYADVPKLIREMVATLAARDATIAEARDIFERWLGPWAEAGNPDHLEVLEAATRAWLAGQPAGEAPVVLGPDQLGWSAGNTTSPPEKAIESLEAERDAARAEVARLEGLVKRAEPIMEDRMKWSASARVQEDARQWLADLRAGRAS